MNPNRLAYRLIMHRPWWVGLVALWALLTALSYLWNLRAQDAYAERLAVFRGRMVFEVLRASNIWDEGHGSGPAGTDSAARFNPAAMTRGLDAILARDSDMRVRLTSLQPLNPGNAARDWERPILLAFARGGQEHIELADGAEGAQFRYMAPLKTLASCLPCHAAQGYREGDLRGAVSIVQDKRHVMADMAPQRDNLRWLHLGAFALLGTVTWVSLGVIRRHILTIETERDRRRRMAERLAAKMEELKRTQSDLLQSEKQASLGRMVAGFAHEVNTPVGVAVGATSHARDALTAIENLLSDEEVSEEALRTQLAVIEESIDLTLANLRRAASLVQSFKRTSVDQISEQERDYDMAELIEDVRRSLHNVFKRTRIGIHVDCAAPLRLHGPAGAVEQILTNLFMNSFHHAYDEGTRPGDIHIQVRLAENGQVRLVFEDDGAGMREETRARAFEPFHTTRRGQGGSGLGLYIVHSLASLNLGGRIHCESAPGRGTRFILEFPGHASPSTRTQT